MGEKKATRAAYGEALAELGARYPELVVLDADLSGSTMSKTFAKSFPERFFNMGIAEANIRRLRQKALHQLLRHVRRRPGL